MAPADPETMHAINALAENLRNAVDARLSAHEEAANKARDRIYDRIDAHARESREQQTASTAELRGAITVLGTQVTELTTKFGAHEKAAEKEVERLQGEIDKVNNKRSGYIQAGVAAAFGGVAGWISRAWDRVN